MCGGQVSTRAVVRGGRRYRTSGRLAALRRHALGGGQSDDPGSVSEPWEHRMRANLSQGARAGCSRALAGQRPRQSDRSDEWDEGDGSGVLRQVPPSLPPRAAPHGRELRGEKGKRLLYKSCPAAGAVARPCEAAFPCTSSPPRLIVPGPSSFPPITCFMSDPSLGCLLSEKSVAPTKRQLQPC